MSKHRGLNRQFVIGAHFPTTQTAGILLRCVGGGCHKGQHPAQNATHPQQVKASRAIAARSFAQSAPGNLPELGRMTVAKPSVREDPPTTRGLG